MNSPDSPSPSAYRQRLQPRKIVPESMGVVDEGRRGFCKNPRTVGSRHRMILRDRISLTLRYGIVIFLIGAVFNLVCAGFQSGGFSYAFMVDTFIIKVLVTAITVYLVKKFRDRDAIFFYINLGLSRRKLLVSVIVADFLSLAILMAIMLFIYG